MHNTGFKSQKGNVLFLILIAVALFGLLTAVVTRSNQGTNTMQGERGTISASDLMAYGGNVEKTVARMLGDDISENGLSFENAIWQLYDGTDVELAAMFTGCASDKCKIFHPAGGGLDAKTFPSQPVTSPANTDIKGGHAGVYSMKITGVGTTDHDLVLLIAGVDQNTCKQLNTQLHIDNPSGFPPEDGWVGAVLYSGAFTGPADGTDEIGDVATQFVGRTSGCVHRAGSSYGASDNYYYQVLLPR